MSRGGISRWGRNNGIRDYSAHINPPQVAYLFEPPLINASVLLQLIKNTGERLLHLRYSQAEGATQKFKKQK
jgi:hypothetical protein